MASFRARAASRAGPWSVTGTAPRAPTGSGRSWGKSLPLRSGESPEGMGRAPLSRGRAGRARRVAAVTGARRPVPGSCGSRPESGGRDRGETPCPGVVRVAPGCCAVYRASSPSTTRLSAVQRAFLVEVAGNRRLLPGLAVVGCWRGGAGGAPGTTRGGQLSKSVAKAPRDGIGREKKRGISTILFRCSGAIRAFATDLDNGAPLAPPRRAPSDQFAPRRPRRTPPRHRPQSPTGPAPHRKTRPRLRSGWRSGRIHDTLIINV